MPDGGESCPRLCSDVGIGLPGGDQPKQQFLVIGKGGMLSFLAEEYLQHTAVAVIHMAESHSLRTEKPAAVGKDLPFQKALSTDGTAEIVGVLNNAGQQLFGRQIINLQHKDPSCH